MSCNLNLIPNVDLLVSINIIQYHDDPPLEWWRVVREQTVGGCSCSMPRRAFARRKFVLKGPPKLKV